MNRRTAESAAGGQNIEVKNIIVFFSKTSAVSAGGGFDLPATARRSGEAGGYSIFKIQSRLDPASIRTESAALYNLKQK